MCPSVSSLSSGTTTGSSNGTMSTAMFTCVDGYRIEGATQIVCQTDGTWSGDIPSCSE